MIEGGCRELDVEQRPKGKRERTISDQDTRHEQPKAEMEVRQDSTRTKARKIRRERQTSKEAVSEDEKDVFLGDWDRLHVGDASWAASNIVVVKSLLAFL